jgi:hypothetical protein
MRFAVALVLLLATGCGDFIVYERVDATRIALRTHHDAVAAAAYAEALHHAIEAGVYRRNSLEFQQRANEALAGLSANQATAGPDRPKLVAWRGQLLLDLGRNDEAWAELQRSMTMRPTLIAARGVLPILRRQGQINRIGETCATSALAITDRNELFRLIELCAANVNPRDETAALGWATADLRAFYEAERARREREAEEEAAAQRASASDEAMRAAQQTQAAMEEAARASPGLP